jgi:hypothetical protein
MRHLVQYQKDIYPNQINIISSKSLDKFFQVQVPDFKNLHKINFSNHPHFKYYSLNLPQVNLMDR